MFKQIFWVALVFFSLLLAPPVGFFIALIVGVVFMFKAMIAIAPTKSDYQKLFKDKEKK